MIDITAKPTWQWSGRNGACQDSCRVMQFQDGLCLPSYAARRLSSLDGGLSQTWAGACHARGGRFQRKGLRCRAAA